VAGKTSNDGEFTLSERQSKKVLVVIIGIDPGKTSGIAIASDRGELEHVFDGGFWDVIDTVVNHPGAHVVVELPTTKHVWHGAAKTKGAIQRTGVNVGSCIREAELIVDYLKRNNISHKTVIPQGKRDSAYFSKVTGWSGRTNQHMRDAAMLIFGMINGNV
jgi:hypothetical protein